VPTVNSSSQRAIPLSARKDLHAHEAVYLGQTCWVIKDPIKLSYFRLEPFQYEVLNELDGQKSVAQICQSIKNKFPAKRHTQTQTQQTILDLYEKGLAWSTRQGQGESSLFRRDKQRWQRLKQTLKNVLFIRLPGFDPTKTVNAGYGLAKYLFHPAIMIWAMVIIVYSWLFMLTHTSELTQRLPSWESLATIETTITLWIVIGVTKVIHELGHAFACKHSGGECHEIGMAFLVFSPCLYCDVSDSWTLRSKWHRIGIALAGVYIELTIASLAFFGWWGSQPGAFHDICFLTFVVSSISTLLFNLNPLLRLDGYYVLSDWLEIPNLRQKADQSLENSFLKHGLGLKVETEQLPSRTTLFFVTYAICAAIYRTFLVAVICCILYSALKPIRLEFLGLLVGILSAAIGATTWFRRIRKSAKRNANRDVRTRNFRPYVTVALSLSLLVACFVVPIPISLKAPLELQYANAQRVYAGEEGQLAAIHVTPGQYVQEGQTLVELFDYENAERLYQINTQQNVQAIEIRKQTALVDPQKTSVEKGILGSLESELESQLQRVNRMTLRAPVAGIVVEPIVRSPSPRTKREMPTWDGSPIEQQNLGCLLARGTHVLTVAPDKEFHAVLRVDQLDAHWVEVGQSVKIRLAHLPGELFDGVVKDISPASTTDQDNGSTGMAEKGEIAGHYLATVRLNEDHRTMLPGVHGTAKVKIESQTAIQWIWRNVKSTFKFQI